MQAEQYYLINGHFEQCLTPADRGFAYGDGVFRTMLVIGGQPNYWKTHYKKLVSDCNALGIVCPAEDVLLDDISRLFLPAEGSAVCKIVVTRGVSARGYMLPSVVKPTRVVSKSNMPALPAMHFTDGVHLHMCQLRLSYQPTLAGIKHLNRLENVLARAEWQNPQYAEGLLLDAEDNIIECTAANIFVRFGQRVITPDLSRCGVAGVTRDLILSLLPSLGYQPSIENIPFASLADADEVMICNSLYGAWQVRSVDKYQWPSTDMAINIRNALMELSKNCA